MNINKEIRRQKKSYNRFLFSMMFIFIILPLILFVTRRIYLFYVAYLVFIEILISLAVFIKTSNAYLKFDCDTIRLRIKLGIKSERFSIFCDKIIFVDVEQINSEKNDEDFRILIISDSKIRRKKMYQVNSNFLLKHKKVMEFFDKSSLNHHENEYYYITIRKGKYLKYELIDMIYKNCVKAHFTENAIKKVKQYRYDY